MSKEKYTPTTEEVRARYAADEFGYSAAPDDPCPEFDRWLDKLERKVIAKYEAQTEKLMDKDELTLLGNHIRTAYLAYSEESLPYTKAKSGFKLWLADIERAAFDDGFAHGAEYGKEYGAVIGAMSRGMWPTH